MTGRGNVRAREETALARAGLEPVRKGQCQKTGSWRASSGIDALNPQTKKPAQWRAFRVSLGHSSVQFDSLITRPAVV
jgi:hypothetical protein